MNKVLSCILSFVPAITYFLALIGIIIFSLFVTDPMSGGETVFAIFMVFMVVLALVAVVATFAMMIWYIVKTCKNPEISTGIKVLWIFLLYQFNVFAFPVFWFIYIRKE